MTDKVAQAIAEISAKLDRIEAMVAELTGKGTEQKAVEATTPAAAESKPIAQPKEEKISLSDFIRGLESRLRDAARKHADWQYAATNRGSVKLEAPARKARYEEERAKLVDWYDKGREQFTDYVAWKELMDAVNELVEDGLEKESVWAAVDAIPA